MNVYDILRSFQLKFDILMDYFPCKFNVDLIIVLSSKISDTEEQTD